MKKIKDIKAWIDGYKDVENACEELSLAFDFVKEGLVEESEIDQLYTAAITKIEDLELRNILRRDEDRMDAVLKINAGAVGT